MSAWDTWKAENVTDEGTVTARPHWRIVGVWRAERDDGAETLHKADTPFMHWSETLEHSMERIDEVFPMGDKSQWPDVDTHEQLTRALWG